MVDEVENNIVEKPEVEEGIKVEIVDDTPEQDRGRKPLPKEVLDKAVDDPLDEYSDKVKSRINQLRKGVHDERRERERAQRERDETTQYMQRVYEENKQLKQKLSKGEKVFISEVTKAAMLEADTAKSALKRAHEMGDADKITEAQDQLTDAKIKLREFQQFRPSLQEEENDVQHTSQVQQAPRVRDSKAESWREQNTWFGADEEMTALALGLHEKLVRSGVDPRSDDYYQKVDSTMKKRFPDYFGDEQTQPMEKEDPPPRKASTVVAPATRSSAPRQIRLTSSEVAIAKRLGLTPEAYAREKLKLENSNV